MSTAIYIHISACSLNRFFTEEKNIFIMYLCSRPTNDDVDVLKRELIAVQQRMNDMSLEKEQQIENLRSALSDM